MEYTSIKSNKKVVNYIQKNCICPQVYSTVDTEEKNDTTRRLVIVEQRALGGVFCRMQIAECGKLSRGNLWKIECGFFLQNEG